MYGQDSVVSAFFATLVALKNAPFGPSIEATGITQTHLSDL
jgi:hypothetical protein